MRPAPVVAGLSLLTVASAAFAQTPECSAYVANVNAHRVCAAAVDGTRAFHPVFGMLISGGNPTIGSAATLGGLGHASTTLRANAVNVVLPDLTYNGATATVPAGDKLFVPAPLIESSVGLFPGISGGLFALDFLASAQLLPTSLIDNLSVDPNARRIGPIALGLGYGARVGFVRGMGPLPAVSLSIMRREIPRITYGDVPAGDRYSYGVNLQATNFRLIASKQIAVLETALGVGVDKYTGSAIIQFRDPITSAVMPNVLVDLNNSRVLSFVNASLNLSKVRLSGEVGYQGGRDQNLSSTFEGFDTTVGKFFAGLGLRVSF
jgi:hypothetical protein